MAIEFLGVGSQGSGTGSVTYSIPSGTQEGDLLLLVMETANQAVTTPGEWLDAPSSPQGTGTAGGTAATRLKVLYRWVDGTSITTTVSDPGNHQVGAIFAFRGVDLTSPFPTSAGSVDGTADTTCTFDPITTTVNNCWVLFCEARALPDSNTNTQTASTLTVSATGSRTYEGKLGEYNTNAGNGGGFSVRADSTSGTVAYSSASTTYNTSTVSAHITLALAPQVLVERTGDLAATETGNDTASGSGDVVVQGALAVSETGSDTISASGVVTDPPRTGSLAVTETGSDTLAGAGKVIVQGPLDATESADTASGSGEVLIQGSVAASEIGSDIFAASGAGTQIANGSMLVTETGTDTASISGVVPVVGSLSVSEGSDDYAGAGVILINGNLTAAEAGLDTFEAVQGVTPRTGSMSATEGSDVFGGYFLDEYVESGYVDGGVTGTLGRIGTMAAVESGGGVAFGGINAVMKYYNGSSWVILYKDPTVYN